LAQINLQLNSLQGHIQSTSDRVQLNDLQSLLCATLQVSHVVLITVTLLLCLVSDFF